MIDNWIPKPVPKFEVPPPPAEERPEPPRPKPCLRVGQLIEQLQKFSPSATITAAGDCCDAWSDVTGVEEINGWTVVRTRPRET